MKYTFIFLAALIGCQSRSINNDLSTIKIKKKHFNRVKINTTDTPYGPNLLSSKLNEVESGPAQKIFGLNLTPLLYNSFLYVPVIKNFIKMKLDIHVIGGYGFSAVIASLFANSKNINDFEWKVFKLYKKIENYPAFSGKWQRQIRSFLNDEFKDKKVYELSKLLLIPRVKKNKVIYPLKNKVVDEVMSSLTNRTKRNFFSNPKFNLVSVFNKNSSCDICLSLAFDINDLKIVDNNGDKLQIYSKVLGQVSNNSKYELIKGVDSYIDSLYGLEIFYSKYDSSITNMMNHLEEKNTFFKLMNKEEN